jgi:S1-C subfamily serine protease
LWDSGVRPSVVERVVTPGGVMLPASGPAAPDFREAARRVMPSVVSIDVYVEGRTWTNELVQQKASSGSGVIISKDGYVVTNSHVVMGQSFRGRRIPDRVDVVLSDGRLLPAKLVGTDPRADLAVLKVEAEGLQPIEIGDSSKLEVGQWVVAVGNPLGYENTLSVGVVSSVGRPLPGNRQAVFIDGIQTDAAINMGNSGGALCDAAGALVGINTAIASIGGGSIGIGFAIPVNRMRQVVDDIVEFGRAKYGTLGVTVYAPYSAIRDPRTRQRLAELVGTTKEPPANGVILETVAEGSAAARAGLKELDVLTEIGGRPVRSMEDFLVVITPKRPGDTVELTVWSKGETRKASVRLDDAGGA